MNWRDRQVELVEQFADWQEDEQADEDAPALALVIEQSDRTMPSRDWREAFR